MAMHHLTPLWAALLACLFLLAACKEGGVRKQVQDLDYAINDYAYALRWSRAGHAVEYHLRRDGSRPDIDLERLDGVRVTGFTITEKTLDADAGGASVKGELNYYHDDYGTLRTLEYSQSWWYEPETGRWYVESDFPQFR